MAIDNEFLYKYIDSDGASWNIKLRQSTGTVILGLSNSNKDEFPLWPYGAKNLRHITGRDATGAIRRRLTIPIPTHAFYQTVTTVTWTDAKGNTIIREGKFGEKKPANTGA